MAIPQDQSAFDDAFEAMLEDGTLRATEVTDRLERVLDASRLWQCGQLTDDDFREAMRAEGHEARLEATDVDPGKGQDSDGLGDQRGRGELSLEELADDMQRGEADD
jgi:hypothetical protein